MTALGGHAASNSSPLALDQLARRQSAFFLDLAQRQRPQDAAGIVLVKRPLGSCPGATDGGNGDPHPARSVARLRFVTLRRCFVLVTGRHSLALRRRCLGRHLPHLLQLIEDAHLRPEQMHDHVAGIDQHPVAVRLALDRNPMAVLLQHLDQVVGKGRDLNDWIAPRRPA